VPIWSGIPPEASDGPAPCVCNFAELHAATPGIAVACPLPVRKAIEIDRGESMNRVLLIDQNRATRERLGLECLGHDVGVALAENLCEGVRVLLSLPVSVIVIEDAALRLTTRELAVLFERVAPGVPVVVTVSPEASLESRVALELAGFRVVTRPVSVDELLEKTVALVTG
jgi:DNA-binding NtrC family response regulator